MKHNLVLLTALLPVVLGGCLQLAQGDLPFDPPGIVKMASPANGGSPYPIRTACYIDTEQYNPLNALDYTLDNAEKTPYFDYVILGAAQIKKGAGGSGASLYVPPNLRAVLDQRMSLIVPMQQRGIKVLLGITGGADDISFGSIEPLYFAELANYDNHFYQQRFADDIHRLLNYYSLDGVEFCDTGAAASTNPATYPYPDGSYEGVTVDTYDDENERQTAWIDGAIQYNYFVWLLRMLMQDYENRPIIVRENNYAAYLDVEIRGAAYQARNDQINFFVNPNPASFGGSARAEGKSVNEGVENWMYGPLSVDLASGTPPVYDAAGDDIRGFSERFAHSPEWYGLIFYSGLKPVSLEDGGLRDTRPGSPTFGQNLTQAEYMSITAQTLFDGANVVCVPGGGNRLKTW